MNTQTKLKMLQMSLQPTIKEITMSKMKEQIEIEYELEEELYYSFMEFVCDQELEVTCEVYEKQSNTVKASAVSDSIKC